LKASNLASENGEISAAALGGGVLLKLGGSATKAACSQQPAKKHYRRQRYQRQATFMQLSKRSLQASAIERRIAAKESASGAK